MASFDVISATILATGDRADIVLEGMTTGGTYAMGLGTNNAVSGGGAAPKMTFTVVSLGYDDTGAATTITRTVYGTKFTRKTTPNEATAEETAGGGNVTVRVWLSDYIYQKDNTGVGNSGTAVKVNILSGFYNDGVGDNNESLNLTCTNSSTLAYQKTIANWSWPGYERITGSSFTLRCCAFERHGQSGRPVKAVVFSATDGTHTVTTTVTTATIDGTMSDAVPVIEYIGTLSTTTLDQGAEITCNFIAYPWVGDSGAYQDSSAGAADPTPLVGPKKMLCDKTGAYGVTMAKVDPVNGNDTGGSIGLAYDEGNYDYATAVPFLTIGKAAAAIAAYNNTNHSRNDVGAGIIDLVAGNYAWLGSSNVYGTVPKCWITVRAGTGVARADCVINAASGNGDISDRIKLENITITVTTLNTFTNILALWLHGCDINTSGTGLFNTTAGVWWVTQGLVRRLSQGLRPASTTNCPPALIRGNNLTGFGNYANDTAGQASQILCYTVIGNLKTTKYRNSGTWFIFDYSIGMAAPNPVNFIVAYNKIYGLDNSDVNLSCGTRLANSVGGAIVQNIMENAGTTGTNGLLDVCSSDGTTTNTPEDNIIFWHNTMVGQRCFMGYNDATSLTKYRRYWSQINNYWDRWANKGDTFTPPDANRVGGWTVTNNVGSSGNVLAQNMNSLPSNFFAEFDGLSSYEPAASSASDYAQFINNKAAVETLGSMVAGDGDGDYQLQSDSPLIAMPIVQVLPYDIAGTARTLGDAAGAYTYQAISSSGVRRLSLGLGLGITF